jgi:hypothetical protein
VLLCIASALLCCTQLISPFFPHPLLARHHSVLVKKREKRLYNEHSNVVIVDAAAVDSHKTYGEHKL